MRSTPFFSRARRSDAQRGYALIMAIVLAVLYFALIELLLLDSQRELAEARRFRARVVAETLAESAAELAAHQLVTRQSTPQFAFDTDQGRISGRMTKAGDQFDIEGAGTTSGLTESTARVILKGRVVGTSVKIWYSIHP